MYLLWTAEQQLQRHSVAAFVAPPVEEERRRTFLPTNLDVTVAAGNPSAKDGSGTEGCGTHFALLAAAAATYRYMTPENHSLDRILGLIARYTVLEGLVPAGVRSFGWASVAEVTGLGGTVDALLAVVSSFGLAPA